MLQQRVDHARRRRRLVGVAAAINSSIAFYR
jgi:hypothetical protein